VEVGPKNVLTGLGEKDPAPGPRRELYNVENRESLDKFLAAVEGLKKKERGVALPTLPYLNNMSFQS